MEITCQVCLLLSLWILGSFRISLCSAWSCSTNTGHRLRMIEVTHALIFPKEQPQEMPWLWPGCFQGCRICCALAESHLQCCENTRCHHLLQVQTTTPRQHIIKDVLLWSDPVLPTTQKQKISHWINHLQWPTAKGAGSSSLSLHGKTWAFTIQLHSQV